MYVILMFDSQLMSGQRIGADELQGALFGTGKLKIADRHLIAFCFVYDPVILRMGDGVGLNPDYIRMPDHIGIEMKIFSEKTNVAFEKGTDCLFPGGMTSKSVSDSFSIPCN